MSRVPLQSFNSPLASPVKVRVGGVPPDSPDIQLLLDRHQAEIRHFYKKASQMHALGSIQQTHMHQKLDGLTLRYKNNNGQETVDIQVTAKPQLRPAPKGGKEPWDWAVVDFTMPLFVYEYEEGGPDYSYPAMVAKLVTPTPFGETNETARLHMEAGSPSFGSNSVGYRDSDETPPMLSWAFSEYWPQVGVADGGASTTITHSLLVDLRKFKTYEEIIINIYAGAYAFDGNFVTTVTDRSAYWPYTTLPSPGELPNNLGDAMGGPTLVDTIYDLPEGTPSPYPDLASTYDPTPPSDYPNHGGSTQPDPYPAPGTFSDIWHDYYTGEYTLVTVTTEKTFADWDFSGDPDTRDLYYHVNTYQIYYYWGYDTVTEAERVIPAVAFTATGAVFRGTPHWGWSEHGGFDGYDFAKWQIEERYPDRFRLGVIGSGVTGERDQDYYNDPDTQYGLPLVGQLHVYPKQGGVSFKPV